VPPAAAAAAARVAVACRGGARMSSRGTGVHPKDGPAVAACRASDFARPADPFQSGIRLAALELQRSPENELPFPAHPIAEQGVPNYSYYLWLGLFAPAGTPKDVVQRLSHALHTALTNKELAQRFQNEGSEAMLMSPDEFNEFLKHEVVQMNKFVTDLHLPRQ
jgi:hypothetical protein